MTTNYYVELDARARHILCSGHRTELAVALTAQPVDWSAVRLHRERIDAIRLLDTHERIALDQAEFELLGEPVPA